MSSWRPSVIDAFRTRNRTPWAYAPASRAAQVIRDFRLSRFETTYVIDAQGFVRYRDAEITFADVLKTAIEGLL